MPQLTDKTIRELPAPAKGNKITYDDAIRGFGLRATAAGAKSFILNYSIAGLERRYTIGQYPAWSAAAARERARKLKQEIDSGVDPLAERIAEREAPTVKVLAAKYVDEWLPRKRPSSIRADTRMIEKIIVPALGNRKVADIDVSDLDRLHAATSAKKGPYIANRTMSLLGKMFSLASTRWSMCDKNPVKGVIRNAETERRRYLTKDEAPRLYAALEAHENRDTADAISLLMHTGARRSEVVDAVWSEFDLAAGTWSIPAARTKQKKPHIVYLSAATKLLLAEIAKRNPGERLFPGRPGATAQSDITNGWPRIRAAAGITDLRLHDLRHSFASELVSSGASLPLIGALLGHSKPSTTARYAHLYDDALRAASELVSQRITDKVRA
jgi:integrase